MKRPLAERKDRRVANAVEYARIMGPDEAARTLAFETKMLGHARAFLVPMQRIHEIAHDPAAYSTRGQKWAASYSLRKAREEVEIAEAVVEALRELQPIGATECPAG